MYKYADDYEKFKVDVLAKCSQLKEIKRVNEEFVIFEQNKWQDYVVLATKVLNAVKANKRNNNPLYVYSMLEGGIMRNSYAMKVYRGLRKGDARLLDRHESLKALAEEGICMKYRIRVPRNDMTRASLHQYAELLGEVLICSGMYESQKIETDPIDQKIYTYILAHEPISVQDEALIFGGGYGYADEPARKREYFVARVKVVW